MLQVIATYSCNNISQNSIEWLLRNPHPRNFIEMKLISAPPQGLFLDDVVYDERMFLNPIPYHYVPP